MWIYFFSKFAEVINMVSNPVKEDLDQIDQWNSCQEVNVFLYNYEDWLLNKISSPINEVFNEVL